ncbi:MAG: hypothetical protein IPH26_02685 [Sterolibacteriaceae bacterium]|uniref:Uncharacterized protein n=1 Tax=Candidatus Methylophosphatis roskildensis TaxID=2899263 RepID=A0A9D7HQ27_9PROT|nr:hypothetical protein [Candidatus Methylophosphatis roskildensis]MBK7234929.1 hypothetical protein [Sterolibacteriaceae bacterium]
MYEQYTKVHTKFVSAPRASRVLAKTPIHGHPSVTAKPSDSAIGAAGAVVAAPATPKSAATDADDRAGLL